MNLIRFARQRLWPAEVATPVQAEDASSMADLVRLLTDDGEPSGPDAASDLPNDEAAS